MEALIGLQHYTPKSNKKHKKHIDGSLLYLFLIYYFLLMLPKLFRKTLFIESQEINPRTYRYLIFYKGGKNIQCLPMQGTWVQSLVREDPACQRATKPKHQNY